MVVLQPRSLYIEITGRLQAPGKVVLAHGNDLPGIKQAVCQQVGNRFFNIRPGGVLRQHRTDHDFKRRITRPPVARPVALIE